MSGRSWRARAARGVLVLAAVALMATSPPPPAEISDEAFLDLRLDDGEVEVLTLVVSLNDEAFDLPFDLEPRMSLVLEAGPAAASSDDATEPLVRGEVRAMDPDGTVFGRPHSLIEYESLDFLDNCEGTVGCEQHFRVVIDRAGPGAEVPVQLRVRARAEYEGDQGDEPPGAALALRLTEASDDVRLQALEELEVRAQVVAEAGLTTGSAQPLVVDLVDPGGTFGRPQQVTFTRIGPPAADSTLVVRARGDEDAGSVELRDGDRSHRLDVGGPHPQLVPLCEAAEDCVGQVEFSIDFQYREGDAGERRAVLELFPPHGWVAEQGGTSLPSVGPAEYAQVDGIVELTPEQPVVDLGHVLEVGGEHLPATGDGRLGALLEVAAPQAGPDSTVRATFGQDDVARTRILTAQRREAAVSDWLTGELTATAFRAPLPLTLELLGETPVRVSWRLEVAMDTLTFDLPSGADLVLRRQDGG